MTLRVKRYHDCPSIRPSMVIGTKPRTVESGVWPFVKRHTVHDNIYSEEEALWTCPECGSEWEYQCGFGGRAGLWLAITRKHWWEVVDAST